MSWTWCQTTGALLDAAGKIVSHGYSGFGHGKNDPTDEAIRGVGPIPCGRYRIGPPEDHADLGPYALPLTPLPGTDTHGRDGFFMHGDSRSHPGKASHGCPIEDRAHRERVWESGDHELIVLRATPAGGM